MAGGTFPTSVPSYTSTAGADTANAAAGGTGLSPLLNNFETDITALATKAGSGSSTPAANTVLYGTGAGTSAWQGLTSAQLASIVSDETGSGALVFGTSPTIVTPTIASLTNAQHDHTNAAGGGVLGTNALSNGAVTAAKLINGLINRKQGGSSTVWATAGTTTTDTSSTDAKIQAGVVLVNANPITVTFPVAFTNAPIVIATTFSATSSNVFTVVTAVTASTCGIRQLNDAGTTTTTENAAWIAIGV